MVMLPRRGKGSGGRAPVNLPTAADVPTVRTAGDPGVNVPQGAFNSMEGVAETAGQVADTLFGIKKKRRTREDTVKRASAIGGFTNEATRQTRTRLTHSANNCPN